MKKPAKELGVSVRVTFEFVVTNTCEHVEAFKQVKDLIVTEPYSKWSAEGVANSGYRFELNTITTKNKKKYMPEGKES